MSDEVKAALVVSACIVVIVAGIALNVLRDYAIIRLLFEAAP